MSDGSLIVVGHEKLVELSIVDDDGYSDEISSFTMDEALDFAAGIVGAAQNTARHMGLSNEEFNARFQAAMSANAAEYAKRSAVPS